MRRPSALGRRVAVTAHCRRARWFDADRGRKPLVDEHRVAKSRLIFSAGLQPLAVKKKGKVPPVALLADLRDRGARAKAGEQLRQTSPAPSARAAAGRMRVPKKLRALRGSSFGANMGRYVSIKTAYESRLNALRASVLLTYPFRPFRPFRRRPCRHDHALRPSEPRQPSPRS